MPPDCLPHQGLPTGSDAAIFTTLETALETARATLGMRHWATVKLMALQTLWLCSQVGAMECDRVRLMATNSRT